MTTEEVKNNDENYWAGEVTRMQGEIVEKYCDHIALVVTHVDKIPDSDDDEEEK